MGCKDVKKKAIIKKYSPAGGDVIPNVTKREIKMNGLQKLSMHYVEKDAGIKEVWQGAKNLVAKKSPATFSEVVAKREALLKGGKRLSSTLGKTNRLQDDGINRVKELVIKG